MIFDFPGLDRFSRLTAFLISASPGASSSEVSISCCGIHSRTRSSHASFREYSSTRCFRCTSAFSAGDVAYEYDPSAFTFFILTCATGVSFFSALLSSLIASQVAFPCSVLTTLHFAIIQSLFTALIIASSFRLHAFAFC